MCHASRQWLVNLKIRNRPPLTSEELRQQIEDEITSQLISCQLASQVILDDKTI